MKTQTALITGANRGLGLETARQLATRGLQVLLTSRGEAAGAEAAGRLAAAGLPVEHRTLDVASPASVDALAEGLRRDGVRLDVLVNNAAIAPHGFNADVLKKTLEVNLYGAERVTDALLPLLNEGSRVVMVSSGLGSLSGGYSRAVRKQLLDPALTREQLHALLDALMRNVERAGADDAWPTSAYNISKATLNALTRIYARDLADRHILVNAVGPGWVRTDMGTSSATRSVEEGAASIVWGALLEGGPTGGFFRDGQRQEW